MQSIGDEDFIFHYSSEDALLLKANEDGFEIPRKSDFSNISDSTLKNYLFSFHGKSCFLVWDSLDTQNTQISFKELSIFRSLRQDIAWLSMAGFHLRNWYSQNKFCGQCGSLTQHKKTERALQCPSCNNLIYPKIAPAVIVAICCNNQILLARNSSSPGGRYSLIAGYVEVGESLEETVRREVQEEVGIQVHNIRYYKSQPWPLSGSMMVGFVAEADSQTPLKIDHQEIAEAAWYTRGQLPPHSLPLSIAGEMIQQFENGNL